MRTRTRGVLTAILTVTVVLTAGTTAQADKHKPVPTQAQVDKAKAAADKKAGDVASLKASLAVANARLHTAAEKAEIAAEAYNGAMWRLQQATKATADARAAVADAQAQIATERAGIAQLVTQSYQDAELTNVTAILGGDDPSTVMSRMGVVESAGDSMQAKFDKFTALNALAQLAQGKAEKAEQAQKALAAKAAKLRDEAARAANSAASETARIAGERKQLLQELADAQKISLELATKRQQGLEKQAEEAAAHAAQVAATKAKHQTNQAKDDAEQTLDQLAALGEEGGWELPGLPVPAGTSAGAKAAIDFARKQLGEPYVWGAAGPDSWDCSGLTMMAWRQGGISLPHYSAAQYQQTKHITAAQLKAGDLVFWGTSPNTIHHVALYIGNGQIIQAPHTGDVVKVSLLYATAPDFFGRP
ncbi:MAG TPA: C40 family peptidase [Marmoricola sp.]|nr:C40 family peptidase [Marmoricola sp.]